MGNYVYKYVFDNQIIYIGKNDTNLQERIIAHQREEKFKPYIESDIYYIEVKNKAESSGLEKLLINKYKPLLNIVDKYETTSDIQFEEPEWNLFTFHPIKRDLYQEKIVPIWEKANLTVEEMAAYSGIGINKIKELSNSKNCPFVLWVGSKRLIKRKLFDEYIEKLQYI